MKRAFIGLSVILEHLKKSAHYSMMLLFLILSTTNAPAESTNVKIMMDWVIGSTHAPFFIAQDKGYYRANGVTVDSIDAGRGATNVAVSVAGGVYQFGWVDLPSMIRFNAQNPASPLIALYMSFDDTPSCIVTLKSTGIKTPEGPRRQEACRRPGHGNPRYDFGPAGGRRRTECADQLGCGQPTVILSHVDARRGGWNWRV
jgi:ABC-type nitrate/sulfonate/bicarbonate transport system substrate-binding protein